MDVYTIVIGVIVLLLVGIFFYLLYSGFFYTYSIRCTVPASIPSSYAYIVHTGPYHDVGVAFKKLTYLVPRRTLFGIYYDDPGKVPASQLRCIIGCDLSGSVSTKEREMLAKNGYGFSSFPECRKAIVTEFPFRTKLSILIAVRRVYPALLKYIEENNVKDFGPFMEIYKDDAIQFVVVLQNNDGFYVPEIPMESMIGEEGSKKTD